MLIFLLFYKRFAVFQNPVPISILVFSIELSDSSHIYFIHLYFKKEEKIARSFSISLPGPKGAQ
jgi:hypothetical protein